MGWIVRMAAACCGRPAVRGSVSEGRRGGVGVGVWRQRVRTQGSGVRGECPVLYRWGKEGQAEKEEPKTFHEPTSELFKKKAR